MRWVSLRRLQPAISGLLLFLLILSLTYNLSGCSSNPGTPDSQVPQPGTATPTIEPTSITVDAGSDTTPSPTPPEPPEQPLDSLNAHYWLDVTMNYGSHFVSVEEVIAYTNRTSIPMAEISLMVETNTYPDVFYLKSLNWQAGRPPEGESPQVETGDPSQETLSSYTLENNILTVPLPQPLPPGESLQLRLSFELSLPSPVPSTATRPVPFGYTPRQTNLVDWYPYIPPFEPEKGWIAHPPSFYGEHQVYEIADFDVVLRFDPAMDNLVVAASALDEDSGPDYLFELGSARNFALSVSDQYRVDVQNLAGVTILSYSFPYHESAGQHALQTTVEAFTLFDDILAPYPHPSLSIVEADFLDGMEYDGLYFLSNGFYNLFSGSPADYLTTIAAHETAHQWWYGLVGNDQALEPWLDEALCTYSELLYYQEYHPEALDWWWTYRINYYEPSGWVDTNIYNPDSSPTPYSSYRSAVYLNGAKFMADLRAAIGDPAFFAFIKDYTTRHSGEIVSSTDFFDTLEMHTQEDLHPLQEQYFRPR